MSHFTKDAILQKVTSKEILEFYLKPFHSFSELRQGRNISNPFLAEKQKTPSFNIYLDRKQNEWKFKDFSTDDKGNCFDLVMKLKNLDFKDALKDIVQEMGLSLDSPTSPSFSPQKPNKIQSKQGKVWTKGKREISEKGLKYFAKYGITPKILKKYKVYELSGSFYSPESSTKAADSIKDDDLVFVYAYIGWVKTYRPFAQKGNRFSFKEKTDKEFVFGKEQLPEKGDCVFITGGEKDVMTLASQGFYAITLNSETADLKEELANELRNRFKNVIVLYDNDETGVKASKGLGKQYGFPVITLPEIANNGKDISDYFAANGSKENFEQMIAKSLIKVVEKETQLDLLKTTPTIPSELIERMPSIIKRGASAFTDKRQKDVFITAALATISACLPNVTGVYDGAEVYPNLFTFIIAPSATGKSGLKHAKKLAQNYHNMLVEESKRAKRIYDELMAAQGGGNKGDHESPMKPKDKVLFIPGNSSYAKIIWHLSQNDGGGLICETEADTVGQVMKKEWGDYSTLIRIAFENEDVASSKKFDNEYVYVPIARFSFAISGTPGQTSGVITSPENGTFSRIVFYLFRPDRKWRDVSPQAPNRISLKEHFAELSEDVLEIAKYLESNKTTIDLSPENWQKLNKAGEAWLNEVEIFEQDDAGGIVFRLGAVLYRIAMILTALRKGAEKLKSSHVICTDEDFNTALSLAEVYFRHSLLLFNNLPKQDPTIQFKKEASRSQFFAALPEGEFSRQDALEIGKCFRLGDRTIDNLLGNAVGTILEKIAHGKYKKLSPKS